MFLKCCYTIAWCRQHFFSDSDPGNVDVDLHPRLIYKLTAEKTEFLHPLTQTKLLFAVPKNLKKISDRFRFNESLTFQYQMLILAYFLILSSFGIFFRRIYGPTPETDRSNLIMASIGLLLNVSLVTFKKLRHVVVAVMLLNMFFNAYFQATYFEVASIPRNHDINTLEHLLNTDLQLTTTKPVYNCLNDDSEGSRIQQIRKRLSINPLAKSQTIESFSKNPVGVLLMEPFSRNLAQTFHDEGGRDLVHVVPESVLAFYLAMMARKDLPFIRRFNELIGQQIETGLVEHEFSKVFHDMELMRLERVKRGKVVRDISVEVVTFEELVRYLLTHRLFLMSGFVAFIGELVYHKFGDGLERTTNQHLTMFINSCYEMLWSVIIRINAFANFNWIQTLFYQLMKHFRQI